MEKENGIVIKTGVLAPLGTLIEELVKSDNADNTAAVTTKIKAKLDELAITSEEVKKEATKIQTATVAYVTKKKKTANELALTQAIKTLEVKAAELTVTTAAFTTTTGNVGADDVTKVTAVETAIEAVVAEAGKVKTAATTAGKSTTEVATVEEEAGKVKTKATAATEGIVTTAMQQQAMTFSHRWSNLPGDAE